MHKLRWCHCLIEDLFLWLVLKRLRCRLRSWFRLCSKMALGFGGSGKCGISNRNLDCQIGIFWKSCSELRVRKLARNCSSAEQSNRWMKFIGHCNRWKSRCTWLVAQFLLFRVHQALASISYGLWWRCVTKTRQVLDLIIDLISSILSSRHLTSQYHPVPSGIQANHHVVQCITNGLFPSLPQRLSRCCLSRYWWWKQSNAWVPSPYLAVYMELSV